jgi:uncharacterized protein
VHGAARRVPPAALRLSAEAESPHSPAANLFGGPLRSGTCWLDPRPRGDTFVRADVIPYRGIVGWRLTRIGLAAAPAGEGCHEPTQEQNVEQHPASWKVLGGVAGAKTGWKTLATGQASEFNPGTGWWWADVPGPSPGRGASGRRAATFRRPRLVHASRHGLLDRLAALLAVGAQVDEVDAFGVTALTAACAGDGATAATDARRAKAVAALVAAGADVECRSPVGTTPLMDAAEAGSTARCAALLAAGAAVDATDPDGSTALGAASVHDAVAAAALLLAAGASIGTRSLRKVTPLQAAAKRGATATALVLVWAGADASSSDALGLTVLMDAAWTGSDDMLPLVRALLAAGADVHAVSGTGWPTIVYVRGAPGVARALLAAGADANASGPRFAPPLATAASRQNFDVVRVLLNAGADASAGGDDYMSPPPALLSAAGWGEVGLTLTLLAAGADLAGASTLDGGTVVLSAAACPAAAGALVPLLLAAGADPVKPNNFGLTPLHWAARNGNAAVARALLAAGAAVDARVDNGETPLCVALCDDIKPSIVAVLLAAGADAQDRGPGGATILRVAASHGLPGAVLQLLAAGADGRAVDPQGWSVAAWAVVSSNPPPGRAPIPGTRAITAAFSSRWRGEGWGGAEAVSLLAVCRAIVGHPR